ncbi:hypothetical protein SESBI_20923 [Sesbania bispinosa]|nr:hypothetical protein SESBI_20923 [Sesbania bispinosa]
MAEIPVTSENPPTMEQRMERLEGSFSQILELLKTVIPEKEVINDNSNGNDNDGGGPSIKTNGPEVKVREEEAKMMDKMEMLEEKRALQGIDVYGSWMEETSQVGNSAPPQVNNVPFPASYRPSKIHPISRKERVKIDPVPIPYSDLYDTLLQQHLVAPEVTATSVQSSPQMVQPS